MALLFPEKEDRKKIQIFLSDSVTQSPVGKTRFRDHKF